MLWLAVLRCSIAILLLLLTDLNPLSLSIRTYEVQSRRLEVWSTCQRRRVTVPHSAFTDDYSVQINDLLVSLHEQGGGAVIFTAGIYPLKKRVVLKSNTCLIGNDSNVMLHLVDYSYPFYPKQGVVYVPKNTRNVAILRLSISGNHDKQLNASQHHYYSHGRTGIYIDRASAVWVRDINVYNNSNHGIYLANSSYITLTGVQSRDNLMDGIAAENSKHVVLRNVTVQDNLRDGVSISGKETKEISLYTTMSKHNLRCGISTSGKASRVTINKSCADFSGTAGICMEDCRRIFVSFINITTDSDRYTDSGCFVVDKESALIILGDSIRCENHQNTNGNNARVFVGEHSRSSCTRGIIYEDVCVPLETWGMRTSESTSQRVKEVRKMRHSCSCTPPPCTLSNFEADRWPVNCVLKNGVLH